MSAVTVKELDRRLHAVLVVRSLGGLQDSSSLNRYADHIEKAPRLVLIGHLLVLSLRVLRGRSVA